MEHLALRWFGEVLPNNWLSFYCIFAKLLFWCFFFSVSFDHYISSILTLFVLWLWWFSVCLETCLEAENRVPMHYSRFLILKKHEKVEALIWSVSQNIGGCVFTVIPNGYLIYHSCYYWYFLFHRRKYKNVNLTYENYTISSKLGVNFDLSR